MFEQGGLMMYPLALCYFITFGITLERGFNLRRKHVIRPEVASVIQNIRVPDEIGLALSVCRREEGPFANVMRAGLDNLHLSVDEIKEGIRDQGRQEMSRLKKGIVILETIASVSPLLGLLGTVLGMIKVFNDISQVGVGQGNMLAGGIAEAILTTAAGLFIAIPSLVFYNYFSSKAESMILEIENYANGLLKTLRGLREAAAPLSVAEGGE